MEDADEASSARCSQPARKAFGVLLTYPEPAVSAAQELPSKSQSISLKLIQHFVVICNSTSLSNAARQLKVQQSNLSLQMNELEQKLEVKLMHRSWRGIELTQAGQYFLSESIAILQRFDRTKQTLKRIARENASAVICGSFSSLDYTVIPKAIKGLRSTTEGLEVKVVEMSSSSLPDALASVRIHVAVMLGRRSSSSFEMETLQTTTLDLIAPSGHRLTRSRRPLTEDAFDGETFWLVERDLEPELHRKTIEYLDSSGVSRGSIRHASSLKETVTQVSSGGGVALLPSCLEQDRATGVIQRSLGDASPVIEIVLCHRGSDGSPLSQLVAQGLVEATRVVQDV